MRSLPCLAALTGLLAAPLLASCVAAPATEHQVRVRWGDLSDPTADVPPGVEALLLLVYLPDGPEDSAFTVEGLMDSDNNGRLELVRPDLPIGEPIRMVLLGGPADGNWTHVGSVGPLVLSHGERRYVDIRMYGLTEATSIDGAVPSARFLHTATALSDGRVLIAGGFERATPATCPTGAPAGAVCQELVAASDAHIFDATTGRFHRVRSPLLAARGAHTATRLPDGRVLLAGGTGRAFLVARAVTPTQVELSIAQGADTTTAATYEIFEPEANPEEEDIDADGDPGRGGFLGSADAPSRPGALDLPRVLHAAAALDDGRVVIAGGAGASASYTVWDPRRAGGYGVIGTGPLPSARVAPGAAVLGNGAMQRVLVAGGGDATNDMQLADVWLGGTPLGTAASANLRTTSGLPQAQWNLYRPIVESVGANAAALVLGWYGPWCPPGMNAPTYTVDATSVRCAFAINRAYTFDPTTNLATGTPSMRAHAFGASTRLDDGTIVVSGGVNDLTLEVNASIDMYGTTVIGGAAQIVPTTQTLRQRRALHATAALPEGGFLVFGGATLSTDGRATLTPVAAPEVLFAQRPRGR